MAAATVAAGATRGMAILRLTGATRPAPPCGERRGVVPSNRPSKAFPKICHSTERSDSSPNIGTNCCNIISHHGERSARVAAGHYGRPPSDRYEISNVSLAAGGRGLRSSYVNPYFL